MKSHPSSTLLFSYASERIATARRTLERARADALGRARGFTLIELMVSLLVFAILATLAAASMSSTLSNNRVYSAQTEFIAYLAYARSEALRRGVTVILTATTPVSGNAFAGGWSVFVDSNGNGSFDSGETVLRSHEALQPGVIVGDGTTTSIAFNSLGFLTPGAAVDIKVCPSNPSLAGFDISVQPSGLADVKDVAINSSPCS